MKKLYFISLMMFVLCSPPANAAEIDSVTPRKIRLEDSLETINRIVDQRIQQAVKNANAYREYIEEIDEYLDTDNECNVCDGSGKYPSYTHCGECHGTGYLYSVRKILMDAYASVADTVKTKLKTD